MTGIIFTHLIQGLRPDFIPRRGKGLRFVDGTTAVFSLTIDSLSMQLSLRLTIRLFSFGGDVADGERDSRLTYKSIPFGIYLMFQNSD